jgi:hypothetical protein
VLLPFSAERHVNSGRTVFSQVMDFAPLHEFRRCVERYDGNRRVRTFTCWDHFLVMAFAQLTYRESLRDIEACLRAMQPRLYHMGIRSRVSRNTLAVANEKRDWRIYADFAQVLIAEARRLYADEPLAADLDGTVYALDSTTIDLCLSLFPWTHRQQGKSAVKLHTLLDLRGSIPAFAWITTGKVHDVNLLDELVPEPGAIYVFDRGYVDFARLFALAGAHARFVIRAKKGVNLRRLYSRPVDRETGLVCDQIVRLGRFNTAKQYPAKLRRVRVRDLETGKAITLLSNDFALPALTITQLYRSRWQVELFFRWIKQHLRIKRFYGTSPNAVRVQIWIAISTYVLVAIARKRLANERDLYTILQVLSITLFEKVPLAQALSSTGYTRESTTFANQLQLFDF